MEVMSVSYTHLDVYKRQHCIFVNLRCLLLPCSLGNGSMVMAKRIVFEIIAEYDCTTLKT